MVQIDFKVFLTQISVTSAQQYGLGIQDLEKIISDPGCGSRGQKNTGSRIRNTAQYYDLPGEKLSFLRFFIVF